MPVPHHSVFTGRMPFLPPNQQRQSTEGAWKKYMENLMNDENEWDYEISSSVRAGPPDCCTEKDEKV